MKKILLNPNTKGFEVTDQAVVVGTKGTKTPDEWRTLGFDLVIFCKKSSIKEIKIKNKKIKQEFIEGTILGQYEYNLKKERNYNFLYIKYKIDAKILNSAQDIIYSQNIVKDLVNTPPNLSNSHSILKLIRSRFEGSNIKMDVYNDDILRELDMDGHLAVNAASRNSAMTIKLSYKPEVITKETKHHIFVGKGLTYDSGGLSIKPTKSMVNMQADKAGAMTLVGLMEYIKTNGSEAVVTCYLALAENMINENSYRPGDILTMKNGLTVKINNTDAEGRIVLADNISLAQEENEHFDSLTTIATLTGSAVQQFGNEAAGLVSFNNKLKNEIQKAGKRQGEIFLDAPFHKYMLDGVNDEVADLSNTGTPTMGCQKAGLFLSKFVEKKSIKKFIHIDIAGPAFVEKGFGSYTKGATGFGVRTLIELIK